MKIVRRLLTGMFASTVALTAGLVVSSPAQALPSGHVYNRLATHVDLRAASIDTGLRYRCVVWNMSGGAKSDRQVKPCVAPRVPAGGQSRGDADAFTIVNSRYWVRFGKNDKWRLVGANVYTRILGKHPLMDHATCRHRTGGSIGCTID
ncbi:MULTISPECIES: hypothetical protein [Catenuloplanes]|uniref:Uncharacterized protein n=1 Tax=Catenuloplanes niger TaxID=587534 RepID=A0AAE4CYZ2_9ACTN|nr:hypothetical protein [Catenuloplanes niger]MDR7328093.1 hypothetical protein [Catenuloplanes niger]